MIEMSSGTVEKKMINHQDPPVFKFTMSILTVPLLAVAYLVMAAVT